MAPNEPYRCPKGAWGVEFDPAGRLGITSGAAGRLKSKIPVKKERLPMRKKGLLPATLAWWFTVAVCGAFAQQQPRTAGTSQQGKNVLVLHGGLLIDGTGGPPLPDPVITIAEGIIQSVGARGSAAIPSGATVMDTTGKTIIPGLLDSHVHFRNSLAPLYLYWGVTTVGDLGNPATRLTAGMDFRLRI